MRAYFDAFESIETAIAMARHDPSMYTVIGAAKIVNIVAAIDKITVEPIPASVVLGRKSDVDAAAGELTRVLRQREMILQRIAALRRDDLCISNCTIVNPDP